MAFVPIQPLILAGAVELSRDLDMTLHCRDERAASSQGRSSTRTVTLGGDMLGEESKT